MYLPAELGAQAVAHTLAGDGWDAEWEQVPQAWLVTATTFTPLSDDSVRATRSRLELLASDYGGEYDGWEAAAD